MWLRLAAKKFGPRQILLACSLSLSLFIFHRKNRFPSESHIHPLCVRHEGEEQLAGPVEGGGLCNTIIKFQLCTIPTLVIYHIYVYLLMVGMAARASNNHISWSGIGGKGKHK